MITSLPSMRRRTNVSSLEADTSLQAVYYKLDIHHCTDEDLIKLRQYAKMIDGNLEMEQRRRIRLH